MNNLTSPDLGARLRGSVIGCEALARFTDEDGAVHEYRHSDILAIQKAERCADCWALLVAAIRAETLEEAARVILDVGEEAESRKRFDRSDYERGVRDAGLAVRALTGSQTHV